MSKGRRRITVLIILIVAAAAAHGQQSQERGVAAVKSQTTTAAQQRGTYHAFVIGIDNYQNLPKLGTAVSDANSIAKVLHDQYGFEIKLLTDDNASYQGIVSALSEYVHQLQENDNLLIYYAGHGMYDKDTDTAYWLPADAEPDDDVYWIFASLITTHVHAIRARHVLVVSDSCFSGMLTRSVNLPSRPPDPSQYLRNMLKGRSRHLMSSGGNEPVLDEGAPGHSVFSWAFLQALNGMKEQAFTATDLFGVVQRRVAGGSEQVPQYMPIRNSGDVEGDFVFLQSQASAMTRAQPGSNASKRPSGTPNTTMNQPRSEDQSPASSQSNREKQGVDSASNRQLIGSASTLRPGPASTAAAVRSEPSEPNFEGTWIEINPKNPENPRSLVLQQNGDQIVFAGFQLTLKQGVATRTGPQNCAPKFQQTGYDYGSSNVAGTVTFKMSLQDSTLVYESDVNWLVPCDGHRVGNEQQISRLQRTAAAVRKEPSEPNFGGTWIEINPINPKNPRNLVLQQNGDQVVFAGFQLTLKQGVATRTGPQNCAPKFQQTGYDYGSSNVAGTVTFKMSLQDSTLVYENDVNWLVPCDGHRVGNEQQISRFQRLSDTPVQHRRQQSSGFRVTQVNLYPTPGSYQGQCPVAIRYHGVIVASGPGTVRYTFLRSDNATAPVFTLHFESAGAKEVFDTWQVGGSGRTFGLWKALKILDPPPAFESNKAITTLFCEAGTPERSGSLQQIPLPHGQDTCEQGFVWREAVPKDHVCVTPQVRMQAAVDNRQ